MMNKTEYYDLYLSYKLGKCMRLILSGENIDEDVIMPLLSSCIDNGVIARKDDLMAHIAVKDDMGFDAMPIANMGFIKYQCAAAYIKGVGVDKYSIHADINPVEEDYRIINESIKYYEPSDETPIKDPVSDKVADLGEGFEFVKKEIYADLSRRNMKILDGGKKVNNFNEVEVNRNFHIVKS